MILAEKEIAKKGGGAYSVQLERANRGYALLIKEGGAFACPPVRLREEAQYRHHETGQLMTVREYAAELLRYLRES